MVMTEVLTEREQQALEHMRKAQELGSTLKAYAAAKSGLEIQQLYELRRHLVRKGAFGQSIDKFVKSPVQTITNLSIGTLARLRI
jgi:hypothetical protein